MVAIIKTMPMSGTSAFASEPLWVTLYSRWHDSTRTWMKEAIMRTLKMTIESGSRRRLPTGYLKMVRELRYEVNLAAAKMITVLSRSRALSTNEARRETESEESTATPFPMRRTTLMARLMLIANWTCRSVSASRSARPGIEASSRCRSLSSLSCGVGAAVDPCPLPEPLPSVVIACPPSAGCAPSS